jgi:hypothetical protein
LDGSLPARHVRRIAMGMTVAVTVIVGSALGVVGSALGQSPAGSADSPSTTTTQPGGGTRIPNNPLAQGAYAGPADPTGVAAFASATSTRPAIATDYLPANSGWSGMDGSGGSLAWLTGGWKGSGYTLSLGVPMIPTNSNNVAQGTLALGATGTYNAYFVTLAKALVAGGDAHAYLRLGWEFDGNWSAWQALTPTAEASYALYFDQIVTAMRSVKGQAFSFVWNPDGTAFVGGTAGSGYNVSLAYPGNSFVNVIGVDIYDQTWVTPQTPANAWSSTTSPALVAAKSFASAHGKPLAFCEWGVAIRSDGHGLGDDPLFINNMAAFMMNPANNVSYESYFNFNTLPIGGDTNADLTGGSFPNSLAAFVTDFGGGTVTN